LRGAARHGKNIGSGTERNEVQTETWHERLLVGGQARPGPPLPPPCQGGGTGRGRGKPNRILAACGDTASPAVCRAAPPNQMGAGRARTNTLPVANRYAIRHERWKELRAAGMPVAGERPAPVGGICRLLPRRTVARVCRANASVDCALKASDGWQANLTAVRYPCRSLTPRVFCGPQSVNRLLVFPEEPYALHDPKDSVSQVRHLLRDRRKRQSPVDNQDRQPNCESESRAMHGSPSFL
jgi:hypothetical protein